MVEKGRMPDNPLPSDLLSHFLTSVRKDVRHRCVGRAPRKDGTAADETVAQQDWYTPALRMWTVGMARGDPVEGEDVAV